MSYADFIHLHNHTQYSLLDGAIKPREMAKYALSMNMPAVAITDHGNMYGAMTFYRICKEEGIKPIIGCEVYVAPESRFKKSSGKSDIKYYHLILLAKNIDGYHNLIKLVSAGFIEGFYYKPRIDDEILKKYSEGLIGMSACLQGEIPYYLLNERHKEAEEKLLFFNDIFGKDNFYVEIQDNGLAEQERANKLLIELAKKHSIPIVATNDCHYLKKEHANAHEALLCVGTKSTLNDEKRFRFETGEFYFKSPEEMKSAFDFCPEAIENTLAIAEKCNIEFDFSKTYLPTYTPPKGMTLKKYLEKLAYDGLAKRLEKILSNIDDERERKNKERQYYDRLKMELDIIEKQGFEGYFLIVWDFINYAKENEIPVGPGRGSAAGSLVAYVLGITEIDPIRYKLFFERFLNPERKSMPDIDVDFCQEKREQVIDYVRKKYGEENVGLIITFGSMKARAVIRDVGRVMGLPLSEVDMIAKLIPNSVGMTLDKALELEPRLNVLIEEKKEIKELFETAKVLEGLSRQEGIHAAGVVVSPEPLVNFIPITISSENKDDPKAQKVITTQYPMEDVPLTGLLKFDFLGLKTLTVIDKTLKLIKENRGIEIDLNEIPLDDRNVYEFLWKGYTVGIFQIISTGMKSLLQRMKPTAFEDLVALLALYRPGPLENAMDVEYVEVKHGKKKPHYEHPLLEDILKETYGVILYQEQVMQISNALSGYSLAEADILRKAMGKKKPEIMAAQKKKFVEGAVKNGIDENVAGNIFDLIEKFAGYGFNKSHSTAYALITYRTAYLKCYYPEEFMAALLSCDMFDNKKLPVDVSECKDMGIKLLPPDVNKSSAEFTIEGNAIRYGLAGIKNVGLQAIKSIIESREKDGPFKSIFDFCERIDLRTANKRVLESLTLCGALDSLGASRRSIYEGLDYIISESQKRKDEILSGQENLFGNMNSPSSVIFQKLPDVEEWSENERLKMEKDILGVYYTGHPLDKYKSLLETYSDCDLSIFSNEFNDNGDMSENGDSEELYQKEANCQRILKEGDIVHFGGAIRSLKTRKTKKGEMMAFLEIENFNGIADVTVFPNLFSEIKEILKEDNLIFLESKVQKRNEELKLVAEKIVPIDMAREEFTGKMFIDIDKSSLKEEALREFRKVVEEEKEGRCQIFFRVMTESGLKVIIKLHNKLKPRTTDYLLNKAYEFFGRESVSTLL
ncbi:MAG: DNA polymerase III subunit alpha [Candidatus Schekmanbacteria bacterium]|nr:MAG: DNA polymerase III subunit alpha [Candidatus Schekmanbacteria bacterium]